MNETTDPSMELLDRRAADAVARLDEAVEAAPIPDFGTVADQRPSRHRIPPAAIAAGLLVLALVAAGFLLTGDRDDDQSTIAGEVDADETGEFVRLAAPDTAAAGLEVTAAFDGTGRPLDASVETTFQGPSDADDPWAAAVLVRTVPVDSEARAPLFGELVDIGGTEAALVNGPVTGIGWVDGDGRQHSIASDTLDDDQLISLAEDAVAVGWRGGSALPGQRVLVDRRAGDSLPLHTYLTPDSGVDLVAVGYRSPEVEFSVSTAPGGEDRYRSLQMFAATEAITVRGRPGVIARVAGLPELASIVWRETDGTVARVETYDDPASVIEALDVLEPVSEAAFDALVRAHPMTDERRLLEFPDAAVQDRGDPFTDRPDDLRAELAVSRDGLGAETLVYPEAGLLQLAFLVDDVSDGASGSTGAVADLDRPSVLRASDGLRDVFTGVVPGTVATIEVEGSSDGAGRTELSEIEQTPVADSAASLFIAWDSDGSIAEGGVVLRIALVDGRTIRYAL